MSDNKTVIVGGGGPSGGSSNSSITAIFGIIMVLIVVVAGWYFLMGPGAGSRSGDTNINVNLPSVGPLPSVQAPKPS